MKNQAAMFKLTYGLFVLSAKEGEKDNGCIVNTVQQVTDTPNRIAVTVNKSNYTHDMILKTGRFNVSILSEDASFEIFQHFGFQSGRDVDKFADWNDYERAENQITYITTERNQWIFVRKSYRNDGILEPILSFWQKWKMEIF